MRFSKTPLPLVKRVPFILGLARRAMTLCYPSLALQYLELVARPAPEGPAAVRERAMPAYTSIGSPERWLKIGSIPNLSSGAKDHRPTTSQTAVPTFRTEKRSVSSHNRKQL